MTPERGASARRDALLAATFSEKCQQARDHLRREMEAAGLFEKDGWTIVETTRQVADGSEIVMRPLHRHLRAPEGMECVVRIDGGDSSIGLDCEP